MEEAALKKVRFSELLGQERAREALVRSALSGRLPHAYLFCGLEGTGRRTAARMLAALLGCQNPQGGSACGECLSCRKLARGTHPDLVMVEPAAEAARKGEKREAGAEEKKGKGGASGRKGLQLTIDQVRELTRRLSFPPVEARVRVSVLWPAGRLNEEAANALLKTLEEPPPGNLLILCCREPGEVLPTIASRCRHLGFAPLPGEVVRGRLLARGADEERAARVAYLAGGSLLRAERLREDGFWERRRRLLEVSCTPVSVSARLELAAELWPSTRSEEQAKAHLDQINDLLEALKSYFRDALVLAATAGDPRLGATIINTDLINTDFLEPLISLSQEPPDALARRFGLVERAQAEIGANCDPQLALEVLFFELAAPGQGARYV
jgi:DNA polymerase-3 subunit delta'